MYSHKIDPEQFDSMMPWERELYIAMLQQKVEEENERIRQAEAERRVKK